MALELVLTDLSVVQARICRCDIRFPEFVSEDARDIILKVCQRCDIEAHRDISAASTGPV